MRKQERQRDTAPARASTVRAHLPLPVGAHRIYLYGIEPDGPAHHLGPRRISALLHKKYNRLCASDAVEHVRPASSRTFLLAIGKCELAQSEIAGKVAERRVTYSERAPPYRSEPPLPCSFQRIEMHYQSPVIGRIIRSARRVGMAECTQYVFRDNTRIPYRRPYVRIGIQLFALIRSLGMSMHAVMFMAVSAVNKYSIPSDTLTIRGAPPREELFWASDCSNGISPVDSIRSEPPSAFMAPTPGSKVSGSEPDFRSVVTATLSPPMARAKYSSGGTVTATPSGSPTPGAASPAGRTSRGDNRHRKRRYPKNAEHTATSGRGFRHKTL